MDRWRSAHSPRADEAPSTADFRRRAELLDVVTEIASRTTARRDLGEALEAIVRRTRELTGSDMAYIALNTAEETFIRYSHGVRTPEYRTIRMPLGYGVLGRAATGRATVVTEDYLLDGTITHLHDIDEIVRGEGVRAILGVPMTLHGVVHGALLVADRSPRRYPEEVVDTVSVLARHTSAALAGARRLEEVGAALARLHEDRDTHLERILDLQDVLEIDARLLESITAPAAGPAAYARAVADLVGCRVDVLDADAEPLAQGAPGRGADEDPAPLPRVPLEHAIRTARATGHPVVDQGITVACALSGDEHLGTLLVHDALPVPLLPRVQRIAVFLTMLLLMVRVRTDDHHRHQRALLDALIGAGAVPGGLRGAVEALELPRRGAQVLAVEDGTGDPSTALEVLRACLESAREGEAPRGIVAPHQGHACAVVPGRGALRDGRDTAAEIAAEVIAAGRERGAAMNVGVSGRCTDREQLAAGHRDAARALASLAALGAWGRTAHGDQLGAVGLVLEAVRADPRARSPLDGIAPLIADDAGRGGDLTRTAWVFAESGGNVARTARRLFVHPNTVRQRLERIARVLGPDWREPSRFLDLHLGLRAWAIAHADRPQEGAATPPDRTVAAVDGPGGAP
ncbi:helix-turn-helix domain-containing protein [Brachybacterium phenoliresistens]|uniref:helix-turn-helix domain-containing protein n=1 Tax=Brachybacterium phenoliresistens TaxID=396014 RepID=UPI0031D79A4F